jgi:hypothetical protein
VVTVEGNQRIMTTGDESLASVDQSAALDDDAAPDTGLEPDTATDAVGEQGVAGSADVEPTNQPDQPVVVDGPAAENDEMRRGTSDLQSSTEKSAEAREIFNDLQRKVLPESTENTAG